MINSSLTCRDLFKLQQVYTRTMYHNVYPLYKLHVLLLHVPPEQYTSRVISAIFICSFMKILFTVCFVCVVNILLFIRTVKNTVHKN